MPASTYSLPTWIERHAASNRPDLLGFLFGNHHRPKWLSSYFARQVPNPDPVMIFPIYESVMGVYDMSGSVSERLSECWPTYPNLRWHSSGSWADGGPESIFKVQGGNGSPPDSTSDSIGFRLVLRMDGGHSLDSSHPPP